MKTKDELQAAIKQYLTKRLQQFHCTQGHLTVQYQPHNISIFTLNGLRSDGRPLLIWELDQSFRNNVDALLEQDEPFQWECRIDLLTDAISYASGPIPPPPPPPPPFPFELSDEPYGLALAQAVAEALETRIITNSHRDYCGTGMEKEGDSYLFGPIFDGGLIPRLRFPDKDAFVQWLAVQSDKSIGGTERYNPQDIDRKRLERFVAGEDSFR